MPGSQHLTPPAQRLSAEEISKKANLLVYEPGYVLPDYPRDISRLDRERITARANIIRRSNTSRMTRRVDHGAGKHSKSRGKGKGKGKRRGKSRGRRKSKGTRR
jgi:hypothetical protein